MNPGAEAAEAAFEPCWAVVEIFGRQRFAGRVGEQAIAGGMMLRLDIPPLPETRIIHKSYHHPVSAQPAQSGHRWQYEQIHEAVPAETKLFGVNAIYALTSCTEERARAEAARITGGSRATRIENIIQVSTAPAIEAAAPVEETFTCDHDGCGAEQTFTGESTADCIAKARAAGWNLVDDELGEEGMDECPDHAKEPF